MQKFKSVDNLVSQLKPEKPVYCIRKESRQISSKIFQNKFPGEILYAMKANPHPIVLNTVMESGSSEELIKALDLCTKKIGITWIVDTSKIKQISA